MSKQKGASGEKRLLKAKAVSESPEVPVFLQVVRPEGNRVPLFDKITNNSLVYFVAENLQMKKSFLSFYCNYYIIKRIRVFFWEMETD